MDDHAPVHKTVRNCSVYSQGACPKSARDSPCMAGLFGVLMVVKGANQATNHRWLPCAMAIGRTQGA